MILLISTLIAILIVPSSARVCNFIGYPCSLTTSNDSYFTELIFKPDDEVGDTWTLAHNEGGLVTGRLISELLVPPDGPSPFCLLIRYSVEQFSMIRLIVMVQSDDYEVRFCHTSTDTADKIRKISLPFAMYFRTRLTLDISMVGPQESRFNLESFWIVRDECLSGFKERMIDCSEIERLVNAKLATSIVTATEQSLTSEMVNVKSNNQLLKANNKSSHSIVSKLDQINVTYHSEVEFEPTQSTIDTVFMSSVAMDLGNTTNNSTTIYPITNKKLSPTTTTNSSVLSSTTIHLTSINSTDDSTISTLTTKGMHEKNSSAYEAIICSSNGTTNYTVTDEKRFNSSFTSKTMNFLVNKSNISTKPIQDNMQTMLPTTTANDLVSMVVNNSTPMYQSTEEQPTMRTNEVDSSITIESDPSTAHGETSSALTFSFTNKVSNDTELTTQLNSGATPVVINQHAETTSNMITSPNGNVESFRDSISDGPSTNQLNSGATPAKINHHEMITSNTITRLTERVTPFRNNFSDAPNDGVNMTNVSPNYEISNSTSYGNSYESGTGTTGNTGTAERQSNVNFTNAEINDLVIAPNHISTIYSINTKNLAPTITTDSTILSSTPIGLTFNSTADVASTNYT